MFFSWTVVLMGTSSSSTSFFSKRQMQSFNNFSVPSMQATYGSVQTHSDQKVFKLKISLDTEVLPKSLLNKSGNNSQHLMRQPSVRIKNVRHPKVTILRSFDRWTKRKGTADVILIILFPLNPLNLLLLMSLTAKLGLS